MWLADWQQSQLEKKLFDKLKRWPFQERQSMADLDERERGAGVEFGEEEYCNGRVGTQCHLSRLGPGDIRGNS